MQRFSVAGYGTPRCLADYFGSMLSIDPDPRGRAWFEVAIATGWTGRGAWDSAWAHIRGAASGADPSATLAAYRLAVAGAWLGYLAPEAVRGLREVSDRAIRETTLEPLPGPRFVSDVESRLDPDEPHLRAEQAWLDGLLAVAVGDLATLREARAVIPPDADRVSLRFRRSLRAFELLLAGDTAAAIDSLWALEANPVAGEDPFLWTGAIGEELPVLRPVNRLALSRWLLAEGDTTRAEGLLYWHEAVHPPLMKVSLFAEGLASLELGRIHEATGRPETARKYYREFLRTDPIDDYAELGAEARSAVTRLEAELAEQEEETGADEADA